jgi:hypothetical protein
MKAHCKPCERYELQVPCPSCMRRMPSPLVVCWDCHRFHGSTLEGWAPKRWIEQRDARIAEVPA